MDLVKLKAFEGEVTKLIPSFKLAYKDESWFQKLLGFFSYPFNPKFMTSFTTTISPNVYFPSKEFYEARPMSSFAILAHELVHLYDCKVHGAWWVSLTTMFPQCLTVLALAGWGVFAGQDALVLLGLIVGVMLSLLVARLSRSVFYVLLGIMVIAAGTYAIFSTGWLSLTLFAALLLLAPWPAPGRVHWELRGYAMQLALVQWSKGEVSDAVVEEVLQEFTGPAYYVMSWTRVRMKQRLLEVIAKAKSGELQKEAPYDMVYRFAQENGIIPRTEP